MSSIDGLASGLNTSDIIKQLMQVEAIPQTLLKNKASTVQAGLDAYASIRTKMVALRTAADALHSASAWTPLTATSSSDAVAVSATSGAATGPVNFAVERLATAMAQSSADTFSGLDAALGARTLSITRGDHTFTSSTATNLRELVAEINADADLGVRATALQVSPGEYRLVLRSADTGVANGFTVADAGWDTPFAVTAAAQDAQLDVGGITVTRPSNTITDLVDGATITLKAVTTDPVTVEVSRDIEGIAKKVKALVDAANGALSEIKTRTRYDAEKNQRSSLTGDPTVRALSQAVTQALGGAVPGSALGSAGLAGVELKRDGTIAFDEDKFTKAYEADPSAVERLFVDGASTSSADLTYVRAGWRAQPGSYAVELTNTDGTYTATIGGREAGVIVNDDGSLRLTVAATDALLGGLTLDVAAAAVPAGGTGQLGTIDYQPGIAKRASTATNRALDSVDGQLTSAEESRKSRIRDIDKQVDAWELRLEKRELALRRQYTALESMLGQLSNQAQWMSGQLAGLQANLSA